MARESEPKGGANTAEKRDAATGGTASTVSSSEPAPTTTQPASMESTTVLTASSAPSANTTSNAKLYVFASKYNTSQDVFNDYVKNLDNGAGFLISRPGVPWQGYQTKLTDAQVSDVKAQPWLDYCEVVPPTSFDDDYQDSRAVGLTTRQPSLDLTNNKQDAELAKRAITERNPTLAHQLKLISAPYPVTEGQKPDTSKNYRYDDSLGSGTTIYIVDTGFNLQAADLAATGRTVDYFVVPNAATLPNNHEGPKLSPEGTIDTPLPEDITDRTDDSFNWITRQVTPGRGHGTGVASAAAGLTYGVASKANLYLIKGKNGINKTYPASDDRPSQVHISGYTVGALLSAFTEIIYHVGLKDNYGKAVVNLSWGIRGTSKDPITVGSGYHNETKKLLEFANNHGIVVVCATGNTGTSAPAALGQTVPQRLGTDDNNLITVGGLNKDASKWDGTILAGSGNFQGPGEGIGANEGSISTWAQATDVTKETKFGVDTAQDFGTSYSSPQVAGLAACFLANPPSGERYQTGTASRQVKTDIQSFAYEYAAGFPSANNGVRSTDQQLCLRDQDGCNTNFTWSGKLTCDNESTYVVYNFHVDQLALPGECPSQIPLLKSILGLNLCSVPQFGVFCSTPDYPNGVEGTFQTGVESSCDVGAVKDSIMKAFGDDPSARLELNSTSTCES
ncbi:peptidase S8/S53 domain-containing protein [Xylariaceae sp. FL0804]|nr:peptidase S8/S53 domain-containing protein [Xylariaceae sp. FL0804]